MMAVATQHAAHSTQNSALGPEELRAGVLELIGALHRVMAATVTPGETTLCPALRQRTFVEQSLNRLELPGFVFEWEPHRTAGPELQNLRVRQEARGAEGKRQEA